MRGWTIAQLHAAPLGYIDAIVAEMQGEPMGDDDLGEDF